MSSQLLEQETESEKDYQLICQGELESCREDIYYLAKLKLGFKDISSCHDEVIKFLDSPSRRKLYLDPRGHLKSSLVSIAKPIQYIFRNPDIRILIDNATWNNSRSFLRSIKEYLMSPALQEIYPSTFTQANEDFFIISTRRNKGLKEPTVDTSGIERTKTSQHYDVIIADDLVVRENVTTFEMMEKTKTHYKDLLDLLEPNGTLIIAGTRWHYADLYGDILKGVGYAAH